MISSLHFFLLGIASTELLILIYSGTNDFVAMILILFLSFLHIFLVAYVILTKFTLVQKMNHSVTIFIVLAKVFSFSSIFFISYFLNDKLGSLIPADAEIIHIPQIEAITELILTNRPLPELGPFGTYYLSNYYFSILSIIFNDNIYLAVMVGTTILLCLNVLLIYRNCILYFGNRHSGLFAIILVFMSQSFFFYSLQLYKECFFYLIVNLLIHFIIKRNFILAIFLVLIIAHERFYAGAIIVFAGVLVGLTQGSNRVKLSSMLLLTVLIAGYASMKPNSFHFWVIIEVLNGFRSGHSVSDAGNAVAFPFSIIQVLLTPIPNLYKIQNWIYQDRLLINAFFFSALSTYSVFKLLIRRNDPFISWAIYTFLGYTLLWSWVAPFNGRARDGIFPLVIMLIIASFSKIKSSGEK
jgi:hypothetical protein